MRRTIVALAALAAAVVPTSASAATSLYAAPAEMGNGDCLSEANSCPLPTAIGKALPGDDVYIRADRGDYPPLSDLHTDGMKLHGTHGRPLLPFTSDASFFGPDHGSLENLAIDMNGGNLLLSQTTATNLVVEQSQQDNAIRMASSLLTDSAVWAPATHEYEDGAVGLEAGDNTLRNDTVVAPLASPGVNQEGGTAIYAHDDSLSGPGVTETLVNVIARGNSAGHGIAAYSKGPQVTVNVSHSNYSSADDVTGGFEPVTLNTSGSSNQTAPPLFADAAYGNFHEVAGSPTIDAGLGSPANGPFDFDGDPRKLGPGPDIGADEFKPIYAFAGVRIVTHKTTVKKGKAAIDIACPARTHGACSGKLTLSSAKKLKVGKQKPKVIALGTASFVVAAGKTGTVAVKLSKAGKKYLKKHKTLAAKAIATAHDGDGNRKTTTSAVTLKRAKKKH